jgi:hypothetical protein
MNTETTRGTGFDRINRMNRIGKRKLKNRSEHEADLPRKSAFAKSHPVNPVHPVQNVFRVAALPRCALLRLNHQLFAL